MGIQRHLKIEQYGRVQLTGMSEDHIDLLSKHHPLWRQLHHKLKLLKAEKMGKGIGTSKKQAPKIPLEVFLTVWDLPILDRTTPAGLQRRVYLHIGLQWNVRPGGEAAKFRKTDIINKYDLEEKKKYKEFDIANSKVLGAWQELDDDLPPPGYIYDTPDEKVNAFQDVDEYCDLIPDNAVAFFLKPAMKEERSRGLIWEKQDEGGVAYSEDTLLKWTKQIFGGEYTAMSIRRTANSTEAGRL